MTKKRLKERKTLTDILLNSKIAFFKEIFLIIIILIQKEIQSLRNQIDFNINLLV
jgi:hypothetical protein